MSEHEQKDARLLESIRTTLDIASEQLDPDTLRALKQVRMNALEQMQKPRRSWQPIAGLAVAAGVTALVIGTVTLQTNENDMMFSHEDVPLLSAGDDLEFYENLEFYQWLAFEERRG